MHRVVGYIRVSTKEQSEEGFSLAAQERAILGYCQYRGFELVEIVVDAGVSAGKSLSARKGGARVLHMANKRGKSRVDGVVAARLDRLFRNARDCLSVTEKWNKAKVDLHLLDVGLDTSTPVGRMMLTMMAACAELERANIIQRTKAGMGEKRAQGGRVSRHPPFGYRFDAEGRLEDDPLEQEALAILRELRAGGMTYRAITEELNRRKVPGRGKAWGLRSVVRILKRPPVAVSCAA